MFMVRYFINIKSHQPLLGFEHTSTESKSGPLQVQPMRLDPMRRIMASRPRRDMKIEQPA
jgi:hypothetical protein